MKELKPRTEKVVTFAMFILTSVILLAFLVFIVFEISEDFLQFEAILGYTIALIIVGIPFLLPASYFYVDLRKKVFIDESLKQITIIKNGKKTLINTSDIEKSFLVKVDTKRIRSFPHFKYLLLVLKERERIFITNLLCEPESIIKLLNLKYKLIDKKIPFINTLYGGDVLTSKEFNEKVLEFEINFKDHSDSKLLNIIKQKNDYADYAREAASRLIEKRKH